jgi:hypothetical protein
MWRAQRIPPRHAGCELKLQRNSDEFCRIRKNSIFCGYAFAARISWVQGEKMLRKILVVGDAPISGGEVLPYSGPQFKIHGHQVGLIGGRAYCQGCNSVGIIAKAGGPLRPKFISEAALEHDVVVCDCPVPQPLRSILQSTATCEDGGGNWLEAVAPHATTLSGASEAELVSMKKLVDDRVTHPMEAEQTERICPGMTNKEFAVLSLKLRDVAVRYILEKRLPELARWDKEAKSLVQTWFGIADQNTREYLQNGLNACVRVLKELEPRNFVRYAEGGKLISCVMPSALGTVAAVCKPDTATHTIAIALGFCQLKENTLIFGTDEMSQGDSQLLALIHEITHFDDIFSSEDTWYGTTNSKNHVMGGNPAKLLANADNLSAYILGIK